MPELKWTGERLVTSLNNLHGVTEHLHRYALAMNMVKGKDVLDIASGEGYGSALLSKVANKVYGVDIDEESVLHANQKYTDQHNKNLQFKVGNAAEIPLQDNTVDVVVSFETIEHHDKHDEMMKEIKRVLKPGGILIISSPEKQIYFERDPNNKYHVKELTLNELKILLGKSFAHCMYFRQRYIAGSILEPEDLKGNLKMFSGSFDSLTDGLNEHLSFYNRPYFNLAVCSDLKIEDASFPSFFDGAGIIESNERNLGEKNRTLSENFKELKNSAELRVGRFILRRFGFVRKFVK